MLMLDIFIVLIMKKKELSNHASVISASQLMHEHDNFFLEDSHVKCVHCIDSD